MIALLMLKKKFLFFGASVTQQGVNHKTGEITGYIPWIKKQVKDEGLNLQVESIAAGSSHFDSAGYALLPKILRAKPDLLILDWHTTGLASFSRILWHSFLSTCLDRHIPVVIAILPRKSIYISKEKRSNQLQAEQVMCDFVQVLDGYEFKNFSPEIHLRDEVHTTPEGGRFYASNILNCLKKHPAISMNQGHNLVGDLTSFYIEEKERPSICEFTSESGKYLKSKRLTIKYKADVSTKPVTLVLDARIGPDSPKIVFKYNSCNDVKKSLWDPYCHYERQTYKEFGLRSDRSKLTLRSAKILPIMHRVSTRNLISMVS